MTATISALIDRTSLGMAALPIGQSGNFIFTDDGYSEPGRIGVVTLETNPFVDGGLPTTLRQDVSAFNWRVYVVGSGANGLRQHIDNLLDAVAGQFLYTVTVAVNGEDQRVYNAYAGSAAVDPSWPAELAAQNMAVVAVSIPVQPGNA